MRTIDVHAHILTERMMERMRQVAPEVGPTLSEVDAEGGVLQVGHIVQRPFPRGGWDLETRFRHMQEGGVDMQVLSVCPQTFLYDLDAKVTTALAAVQNDELAALVNRYPDKFTAIATLPMQDPAAAAAELRRAMTTLGLKGAQIGSHIEGKNLDDPSFDVLWAVAEELGAFILIHPQKVMGGDRFKNFYFKNLIGNPLETTVAASSLVFGGVLERHPNLKICLSHGGGFLPFQTGRMNHGFDVRPEGKVRLKSKPEDSIRRFYFDTILHFEPALRYVVDTFGADHVLLGSDYPFDMGNLDCVEKVKQQQTSDANRETILSGEAKRIMKLK